VQQVLLAQLDRKAKRVLMVKMVQQVLLVQLDRKVKQVQQVQ